MNKVYVLCRKDLESVAPAYPLVQGGHALAELIFSGKLESWKNDYLIYVAVENLEELKQWMSKLDRIGHHYSHFVEPDLGYEITAIAVEGDLKMFSRLPLYTIEQYVINNPPKSFYDPIDVQTMNVTTIL